MHSYSRGLLSDNDGGVLHFVSDRIPLVTIVYDLACPWSPDLSRFIGRIHGRMEILVRCAPPPTTPMGNTFWSSVNHISVYWFCLTKADAKPLMNLIGMGGLVKFVTGVLMTNWYRFNVEFYKWMSIFRYQCNSNLVIAAKRRIS